MAASRGVKIYATYALIVGALNSAGNLALAVIGAMRGADAPPGLWRGWVGAAIGVALVAAGVGVFRLKPWGRQVAIGTSALVALLALTNLGLLPAAGQDLRQAAFVAGSVVFPLILNLALLWFLTRPSVAAQFHPR